MPTDDLLVPSLLQTPGHNQKTISRVLQRQRAINFCSSEVAEPSTLPTEDRAKLLYKLKLTNSNINDTVYSLKQELGQGSIANRNSHKCYAYKATKL